MLDLGAVPFHHLKWTTKSLSQLSLVELFEFLSFLCGGWILGGEFVSCEKCTQRCLKKNCCSFRKRRWLLRNVIFTKAFKKIHKKIHVFQTCIYIYIYMYISTGQPLPQYHPLYSSTDLAKAFKSATSIPYELNFLAVFNFPPWSFQVVFMKEWWHKLWTPINQLLIKTPKKWTFFLLCVFFLGKKQLYSHLVIIPPLPKKKKYKPTCKNPSSPLHQATFKFPSPN